MTHWGEGGANLNGNRSLTKLFIITIYISCTDLGRCSRYLEPQNIEQGIITVEGKQNIRS
jgi:hypothetical protein